MDRVANKHGMIVWYTQVMDGNDLILFDNEKPLRADAARNRSHILRVAARLFNEQSVDCVTMSAIAKEADVGKGTLYRHFSDKGALIHALLDEDMRAFQQETLLRLRNTSDPRQTLRWFLRAAVLWVVEHSEMLREAATQEPLEMLEHPAHLWWRQTIHGLLGQMQVSGDVEYICDVLYALLDVRIMRFQRAAQHYDLERIISGLHMTFERLAIAD